MGIFQPKMDHGKLPDLFSGASLFQAIRLTAHRLGNISILGELLEVFRADARQNIHRRWDGRAGIFGKVVNNYVRANPSAV
jgi:hypothetical protein